MKTLLFLITLLSSSLYSHFGIQGSLLYWSPSYDETFFVIRGSGIDGMDAPTPDGKRINNSIGYNFGFRIEGNYSCECFISRLRWTHIFATSHKHVSNPDVVPQLWPTELIPSQPNIPEPYAGIASSKIDIMHQRGELLFDQQLLSHPVWLLFLREGIEWSYIRYHEKIHYQTLSDLQQSIQFHGHSKGLGPQVGVIVFSQPGAFFCWFPKCLSLKFETTASLIAANSKAKILSIDLLGAQNHISQQSFWRFIPELRYSFGFHYISSVCNCPTHWEIGYEVATYFRGISKLIFDSAANPGHSFNQYSDFYAHGLYLTGNIFF